MILAALALAARLTFSFTGHTLPLREVAFDRGSTHLISAAADGMVKVWTISGRRLVRTMSHPGGVAAMAVSPDGQLVASAGYDRTIRVWRMRDGALLRTLTGHGGTVWAIAFSADGQRLASGGEDRTVRIWRTGDGMPLRTLTGHTMNVWSVAFSPDGQRVASGSFDRTVKLWRADTGQLVKTLTAHTQAVVGIAYSPDGRWLASGGDDSAVRIWRAADGALVRTLKGEMEHVYTVAFSPDSRWLASGGRERGALGTLWKGMFPRLSGDNEPTVRLWRVADGQLMQSLAGHDSDVFAVGFSPDGKWLATGSEDKTVKLWSLGVR